MFSVWAISYAGYKSTTLFHVNIMVPAEGLSLTDKKNRSISFRIHSISIKEFVVISTLSMYNIHVLRLQINMTIEKMSYAHKLIEQNSKRW